jgi:hypothetical protein
MSLEPARWIGGPEICTKANLPAFISKEKLNAFYATICTSPTKVWLCSGCMRYHAYTESPIPVRILALIKETEL